MTADARIGLIVTTGRLSAGNQDFTSSAITSAPVAAMFFLSKATDENTQLAPLFWCVGATDGSTEWYAASKKLETHSQNFQYRRGANNAVMAIDTVDGAVKATFVSFLPNGVRVNWSGATNGEKIVAALWFGADAGAEAQVVALDDAGVNVKIGTTIDPRGGAILFAGHCGAFDDTEAAFGNNTFGAAADSPGGITQAHHAFAPIQNYSNYQQLWDDAAFGQANSYRVQVTSFVVDGVNMDAAGSSAAADEIGVLVLAGGDATFEVTVIDAPTLTGANSQTPFVEGFTPAWLIGGNYASSVVDDYGVEQIGNFGLSFADGTVEAALTWCQEYGDASHADSLFKSSMAALDAADGGATSGADYFVANFTSFQTDGWNWNVAIAAAAGKMWYLGANADSEAPPPPPSTDGAPAWLMLS